MIRRDEIIDKLGKYNSTKALNNDLIGLEKFIDSALTEKENLIKMINSSSIGSITENDLEIVNVANITDDIHKDITIKNGDSLLSTSGVAYIKWDDDITTKDGSSAILTPWNDRTILQNRFEGEMVLECPKGTNKNTARLLADKYMSIDKKDSNGDSISGYWSNAVRPNDSNNNSTTGNLLSDAVSVKYNKDEDIVYMVFKIF